MLTFVAAVAGYLAATDPIGLPTWAQGVAAVLAVGFAAVGIIPPQMIETDHGSVPVYAKRRDVA